MIQSWLMIGGLAFDFAGFALLLREWWLAFFNESRQIAADEQLERMRHLRSLRPTSPGDDPFAALNKMQDDQAMRRARMAHKSAMAARRIQNASPMAKLIASGRPKKSHCGRDRA